MGLFVNTNVASLASSKALANIQTSLSTSYERLSSGFRINRASDDAAGLQISERMSSSILGDTQVVRNLNDGVGYAQIAEGGLIETTQILQRMRQLSIQAQNGAMSESDRAALNQEVQTLKQEMDRIANSTEAFGRYPLLGENINNVPPLPTIGDRLTNGVEARSLPSSIQSFGYIPAGSTNIVLSLESLGLDDDLQVFTTAGRHLAGTSIANNTWAVNGISDANTLSNTVLTSENGFVDTATYNDSNLNQNGTSSYGGMNITYSGDNDADNNGLANDPGDSPTETLNIDVATENLILISNGTVPGVFNLTASWSQLGTGESQTSTLGGEVRITATNTPDTDLEFIAIEDTPATSAALGLATLNIASLEEASASLPLIDHAIEIVGGYRAGYGANINQIQSTIRNTLTQQENVSSARSRIRDTDYANEVASLSKQEIIQQASISVLAQANNVPQSVLSLLQ